MNLLSHALLSRNEDDNVFTVNVLWDFVGKDLRGDKREFVVRGAKIHRTIDRETDCSDEFKQAIELVSEKRRSLSGVVVDIALDYALSQDWSHYSSENPLELFEQFYERMQEAAPAIGERAIALVANMREHNWFRSYGELQGIQRVFLRLAQRNAFLDSIRGAESEVERRVAQYSRLMRDLYPKVQAAVALI